MRELTARRGYLWTNGDIFSTEVYLSDLEDINDWKEVTEEEAEAMLTLSPEDEAPMF